MSCSEDQPVPNDALDSLDDAVAAAAFRRLARLLQHRSDAANIDLMGLAGFCRNCLGDWIAEAGAMEKEAGRAIVHGMPTADWKARFHVAATPNSSRGWKKAWPKILEAIRDAARVILAHHHPSYRSQK